MDRDRILLTPGPLATTLRSPLEIVHAEGTHVVVPLQSSGTFSVEAAVATIVPRGAHVPMLDNGASCKRAAKLTQLTQVETFRVGCIGAIGLVEMDQAIRAVELALEDLGVESGAPAI